MSDNFRTDECKNHLPKKIGSRLFAQNRSMREKRETAVRKVQLRSTLELSDSTIKALQRYYLAAVKKHVGGNWKNLKTDIMSTYFHCTNRQKRTQHNLCSGKWCFYKQDTGAKVPIKSNKMEVAIRCAAPSVLDKVHETYEDLTRQDLLKCCLVGRNQNPNESLHSKLWAKCLKTKFVGYDKVLLATNVTTLQHNLGFEEGSLLKSIGLYGTADTVEI